MTLRCTFSQHLRLAASLAAAALTEANEIERYCTVIPDKVDHPLPRCRANWLIVNHDDLVPWDELALWRTSCQCTNAQSFQTVFFWQHWWITLFLFVTGVTWPRFPPSSSVFVHYSWKLTLVNRSYSWDSLPGVTERTTTGFSLPATNPKPSTGSRLISTFRGAGGTNLSPSRRTSSRELLWETWLLVKRSSLIRVCVLIALLSVMWQQTKHVSNNNCCLESIFLAHLKILLFKKQTSKCHFQMRPAKIEQVGDVIQSPMFVLSHCRYSLLQSSSAS